MKYIPKLQLGNTIAQQPDNTRVTLKKTFTFPKLNNEQAFNYSTFGTLNSPNNSYNFIQGYKKTPQQQSLSNIELNRVEKLENIQKQKVQEAKNLRHAAEVAPYIIPGLGQAMWLGKGVDLATNRVSRGKYKSWGDMIDKNTGSGEFVGDLTNPGYYAGAFPKFISSSLQSTGKYALKKAEPYLLGDKRIPMMSYKPKINFDSQLDLIDNQNIYPNMYNMSGTSKNQLVKNVSKEDRLKLHPLNEEEFFWTVTKPGGKFDRYKREGIDLEYINKMYKLRDANPISRDNYIEEFNKTVERLNEIISKNNKSGTEYISTGLTINEKGYPSLNFNSEYGPSNFRVHINPAKWDGKVEDISSKQYLELIPGISMVNTHKTVFGDGISRINSGTYKSINEYLKEFNLGRVKSAVHLDNPQQSFDSRTLWEKAIIADKAVGFYADPYSIRGVMKSIIPAIGTYELTQNKKE